ncbi:MAG TPA: CopG family transcriptional regulator [Rhodanobacter sp.]
MSTTTTIRLPEELKTRVSRAAKRAGTTTHSFILNAIEERIDQEEHRTDFHDLADQRYAQIVASGRTVPWTEMRRYLEDRVAGKSKTRPIGKKLIR